MDWADERYVRVYTRDTAEWLALSWQARGLFCLLLRICDRAGIIDLGRIGAKGLAALVHAPWKEIEGPLTELLDDGCVELHTTKPTSSVLVAPNFVEAQECAATSAQRSRESRQRRKDVARAAKLIGDETSHEQHETRPHDGTECVTNDTPGDAQGHGDTPSVPCRAVPSEPSVPDPPVVPQGTTPKKSQSRKTVMPRGWMPNPAAVKRSEALGLSCLAEEEDFRDWTGAKGMLYADWDRAYLVHLKSQAKRRDARGDGDRSEAEHEAGKRRWARETEEQRRREAKEKAEALPPNEQAEAARAAMAAIGAPHGQR